MARVTGIGGTTGAQGSCMLGSVIGSAAVHTTPGVTSTQQTHAGVTTTLNPAGQTSTT